MLHALREATWGMAVRYGSHLASVAPMAATCLWDDDAWDRQASLYMHLEPCFEL